MLTNGLKGGKMEHSLEHDNVVVISSADLQDLRFSDFSNSLKDLFATGGDKVLWYDFDKNKYYAYDLPKSQSWGIWWTWPYEPKLGILIRFKPFQIQIGLIKWGIAIGPRTVSTIPKRRAGLLSVGG